MVATAFLKALAQDGSKRVDSVLSDDVIKRNPALYGDGSMSLEAAYKNMGAEMERYQNYADEITHAPKATPTNQDATQKEPAHTAMKQESTANPTVLKEGSRGDDVEALVQGREGRGVAVPEPAPRAPDEPTGRPERPLSDVTSRWR